MGIIDTSLDQNLRPTEGPVGSVEFKDAYKFDSETDRNIIGNSKIQVFNFGKGYGGTLTLGGTLNGNGQMLLKDASGSTIFTGDSDGHHYFNTVGTEAIRVDRTGLHAYGSAGTSAEQVRIDNIGLHTYGTGGTAQELTRFDNVGFHAYGTAGTSAERVRVDNTGLHNYGTGGTSNELTRLDSVGLHTYGTSGTSTELTRFDSIGFHAYGTGGTSNELTRIDVDGLHGYNSSGSEILNVGPTGINGYGNDGNTFQFYNMEKNTVYGEVGYLESYNAFLWQSKNNARVYMNTYTGGSAVNISALGSSPVGNILILAAGTLDLYGSDVTINGVSKSAIVPSSKGYKALYTNESPEVWFMDFCESKDKIDPLFLEVTSPPYHFIKCDGGEYQVWGIRKGFEKMRFESKTKIEFDENNKFWATPKIKSYGRNI